MQREALFTHRETDLRLFLPQNKESRSSSWRCGIPALCSQQLHIQLQSFYKQTRYFPPRACCWNQTLNKWSVPPGCQRDLHVTTQQFGYSTVISLQDWESWLIQHIPGKNHPAFLQEKKVPSLEHLCNKHSVLISSVHLENTYLPNQAGTREKFGFLGFFLAKQTIIFFQGVPFP